MARKYKYQINSKRGIVKAVERPAGTTPIRESKGAYDPRATYYKGDTVIYGGLYYTATTGTGIPGEGDGWEISGIVSAKGVTLSIRLSKPVLDVSEGAKAVTATATATLGEQDITAGLPVDGWRWTWRGKELSGETNSGIILTDIPTEVGQYPVRVTHKLFGTYAEEQVLRVDVTTKLRAELEGALERLRKSTGDDQAAMAEILGKVNKTLTSLQEQVDNEVSNWFYPGPPSPDKEPESEWVTNQDKYRHIGDTYTSVDESGEYMGKSWRYTTEYKWQEIHDTLISKALSVAAKAQTTADGKSTTYYTQPARYSVGDSWVLSADTTVGGKRYKKGTMLFASATSEVFVGSHWGERLKYIDSAKLDADLRESEKKSKQAWEAYATAKASKAGEDAVKAAKEYAEAQDAAYEERTKAYADQIVTDKEQALIAATDAKAALAEKRAKAYADGKVTAAEQLAIDKAQKAYEDAVKKAKEMDGEIQVGGRNLLRGSRSMDLLTWGWDSDGFQNPFRTYDDQDGFKVIRIERAGKTDKAYNYRWCFLTNALTVNLSKETYTISFDYKSNYSGKHLSFSYWRKDGRGQENHYNGPDSSEWRRGSITLDLRGNSLLDPASKNECLISIVCGTSAGQYTEIRKLKLERGTVATDYTPAPEDVQAEIERERSERETAVKAIESGLTSAKTSISALEQAKAEIEKGKLSISDLPKNLKWIYDAFHGGKTEIEGGLVLSKYIGLSNSSDKVTSYISGEDGAGAHMLAAGVTSLADQDAVSFINYDGSAKFGELEIDKNGWVMISNVGRNKRLDVTHITSDAVCFEDHTGGRWRSTKAHIGMSADGDAMEIIVDGGTAITLSKKGVHVNSFDDRLMPRVLAHGKFDKSGSLSKAIAYNDPNTSGVDSRFSCSRVSEGKYRLTFPGEWLNPWSTLVFQGTEQDSQSGQSARFVSFGPATRYGGSAYVYVFGADDRNLRDVSVYFQIIAL